MSKEKLKTQLWAILIAFTAGFGGMGCMITALRIHIPEIGWITAMCAVAAVVFSLCTRRKLGWIPLCLLALLGGYLWQKGLLEQSVEGLVFQITAYYDTGYGWGAVHWTDLDPTLADPTLALCVIGILVTAAMAWTVAGRHTPWVGATACFLPFASCLVLTNTVPKESYLYLLLTALVLVIMTQSVRRKDEEKGNTLTAMVVIPVAAAMAILLLLCPQKTYDGQKGAQWIEDTVMELLGLEKEELPADVGAVGDYSENTVDLTAIGPKSYQSSKVMNVKDERGGQLYLRGCAYDIYDGNTWSRSEGEWKADGNYSVGGKAWKVTVSTTKPHDVIYMPHVVPSKLKSFRGGRLENPEEKVRYQFVCTEMPSQKAYSGLDPLLYSSTLDGMVYSDDLQQYLQLPEQTAAAARKWLEENVGPIPPGLADRAPTDSTYLGPSGAGQIHYGPMPSVATGTEMMLYVAQITDRVRASATYDLQTGKMPDEETDFAMWFLEESDTGYCVHFATAATVLMRSIGVPARYVTGYLVNTKAGADTMVRLRDAHAWVEIYDAVNGWIALDPTPAGFGSPVPAPQMDTTQPSQEATLPEQTTEPTVPVIPEQTTQATEPEQTTQPSETVAGIGGADQPDPPARTGGGWLWLLLAVAAVAGVIGQWQLRVWLRRKKQHTGNANHQALARWQEVVLHGKLRGKIPEELHGLAQKAKYSQHMLTRQELRQFEVYLIHSRKALRRAPLWRRLYYTLVLAIY